MNSSFQVTKNKYNLKSTLATKWQGRKNEVSDSKANFLYVHADSMQNLKDYQTGEILGRKNKTVEWIHFVWSVS